MNTWANTGSNQVPGTSQDLIALIHLQELTSQSEAGRRPARRHIQELRAAIPLELLRSFDSATDHGRAAIARVTDSGACGGCHLKLPSGMPAGIQILSDHIQKCPNCGCFLYTSTVPCSSGSGNPPLSSSRRPGRVLRVFGPASMSRSKPRAPVSPTSAPDYFLSREDTSL